MSTSHRLCKTAKAWTMLANPAALSQTVRAVLLLANGQRSEKELSLLLGNDVSGLARGLQAQGYLQPAAPPDCDDEDDTTTDFTWSASGHPAGLSAGLRASA